MNEFSAQRIDHHMESVKVAIQPPIDIKEDRIHLQEFFNRVSERQPQLFDSLAQEPGAFSIKKQLALRGIGRLEVETFVLSPAGPVLSFPHKLPIMTDEFQWPGELNSEITRTLSTFIGCHPGHLVHRLSKRRELIFTTAEVDSAAYLRERFATGVPADTQDIGVRWSRGDDRYDRRVILDAVQRKRVVQQVVEGVPVRQEGPAEFGIRLIIEVSNCRSAKPLSMETSKIILDHADSFYNEVLADLRRA